MTLRISAENFDTEVLNSAVPVLVDFYSDSCVPCKRMSPALAELGEEYGGRFKLCKVNINGDLPLSEKYCVRSVPTLVFFSGGVELSRKTGLTGKEATREIMNQILEELK